MKNELIKTLPFSPPQSFTIVVSCVETEMAEKMQELYNDLDSKTNAQRGHVAMSVENTFEGNVTVSELSETTNTSIVNDVFYIVRAVTFRLFIEAINIVYHEKYQN